jgi:NADH-quinone oxidoreductase subunit N
MTTPAALAFAPEFVLLSGALVLFVICLGEARGRQARNAALIVSLAAIIAGALCLGQQALLFDGAYRIDPFSQLLKLVLACSFAFILLLSGELDDIRAEVKPEYYLLLTLSVCGLTLLVSCLELIALVIALELSSFPFYLMVAMRREREGQRNQMESAIKYLMFGVAANGIMLFGLSYLFGLTGTTSLPVLVVRLQPVIRSPLALLGLAMACCGLFYKLAVVPFHFWTPDVYQGASNETTSLIASLPKIGAVAVLVRFVSLVAPDSQIMVILLTSLAVASMCYGNLIALVQKDLKRLLAFSGIAHAGYALIGFVTLDQAGYTAALYYIIGYLFMVLACFVVVCKVSRDGVNASIEELAGLHRRAPLLALTLVVGIFALASLPPFVGFMGKVTLLSAALAKGHLGLVIVAVVNTAIAIYYYLGIVREACFRDAGDQPPIAIDWSSRALCLLLIAGILILGVAPARILERISSALVCANLGLTNTPSALTIDDSPARHPAGGLTPPLPRGAFTPRLAPERQAFAGLIAANPRQANSPNNLDLILPPSHAIGHKKNAVTR